MFEPIGWLVGALLGGFFGYAFALYQKRQESHSMRDVLLMALSIELKLFEVVYEEVHPYKPEAFYYRSPIRLSVPTQLLNSGVLEYKKHGEMITSLLSLNVAIAQYNDFIQVANTTQFTTTLSQERYKQIYDNTLLRLQRVLAIRDLLNKHIGSDYRELSK